MDATWSKGEARTRAREVLKKHRVTTAPTPVKRILRDEQLEIVPMHWRADSGVGGLLYRDDRMVFLNVDHPPVRQRFSLAHELGHYVLLHDYLKGQWQKVDIDHPPSPQMHNDPALEWEANTFANELLVPRALLMNLRSKPARSNDEEEKPFHSPFAVLSQKAKQPQLSEAELAHHFQVSREVLFIALKEHKLI